jgi:hypothetical protein
LETFSYQDKENGMTRINCVPPSELSVKHLIAEYKELPRTFGLIQKSQMKGLSPHQIDIPHRYTMGTGHVKFFYNKAIWLVERQKSLIQEMLNRGYSPNFRNPEILIEGLRNHWLNDWIPSQWDMEINRKRIQERS